VDIGAQQAGHERRQRFGLLAVEQHMKMIAHQTIMKEPYRKALAIPIQQLQKIGMVGVGLEDDLAVVVSVHDVVVGPEGTLLAAWQTRHDLPPADGLSWPPWRALAEPAEYSLSPKCLHDKRLRKLSP